MEAFGSFIETASIVIIEVSGLFLTGIPYDSEAVCSRLGINITVGPCGEAFITKTANIIDVLYS